MIVVGLSRYHNSSVCLLIDGEIAFHVENERLSNIKYDSYPFLALNKIKEYVDYVDVIAIAGLNNEIPQESFSDGYIYADYIRHLGKSFYNNKIKIYNYGLSHHLTHAASSFYNSGFDSAVCIVKDGMGSDVKIENKNFIDNTYGRENMSVFTAAYPNNFDLVYTKEEIFNRLTDTYPLIFHYPGPTCTGSQVWKILNRRYYKISNDSYYKQKKNKK